MSESILVVKTGLLAGIISGKNGLIRGRDAEILDIVNEHHEFRPRPEMEEDPSYRQIIPYVVLTRGEEVFVLRRLKKGGEKRLHGLLSTGGSDFHGMYTRTARPLGSTSVSDEIVQSLLTYKDKRRRRNA